MNFDFLSKIEEFKQLYDFSNDAEELVVSHPGASTVASRNALETLVKSFYIAKYGSYPIDATLFELIDDYRFSHYLDDVMLSCVHFIRKVGNGAAHGEDITKKQSMKVLEILFEFEVELLSFMKAINGELPVFDKTIYENKTKTNVDVPINDFTIVVEKGSLGKYKNNIEESTVTSSNINISEAETRKLYIDESLKEAGWDICQTKGAIQAGKACIEVPLEGMPNNTEEGFVDYVLFDNDGLPLAVIEAKKTSVDPVKGRQQAILYAKCIEDKWHIKPIIFYTNGYKTIVIDNCGYPDRKVYGFYTKDELHSLIIRRDLGSINNSIIDPNISDRYFIQEAATAVCESLNQRKRKALIVMATGTGKTRCAISIVDILQKYNWAKHVLFLADRTALITQARNNFIKYLPDSTLCVLSETDEESRDYNASVVLSTYQTLINIIDKEEKDLGIAHFDLIVVDECHRSIYNKYRAIFNYFDSLLLGLTATPREQVDSDTYSLFDLPMGEPTYSYEFEKAVNEGFLVDFRAYERTTKILKDGLHYDQLSPEEKEQYENLFEDDNGIIPSHIDKELFFKALFNEDTLDRVINTLMKDGIKVNSGETLGKSIIFAYNHNHAQAIVDRFNYLYPELGGKGYCQLIDNYVNYSNTLIETFEIKDNDFRIAVSVDMLDTGIDVPEVVNLVFFKKVFSKIKFWQMIGRGTRTCEELYVESPDRNFFENEEMIADIQTHKDKQGFYIFDFCDVFEFFRMHPDGNNVANCLNLTQRLFNIKLDLISELQKLEHQENEEHKEFYTKYRNESYSKVVNLNRQLINVKTALQHVDKYSVEDAWNYLNLIDIKEIKQFITPLVDPDQDDESAKIFDLWILNMELEEIIGENDYSKAIQKVTTICSRLLDMTTIPAINLKKDFLKSVVSNTYWENITISKLDKIRTEVRDLIKFLPKSGIEPIKTKFKDHIIVKSEHDNIRPRFKNYKQEVMDYLSEHYTTGAIYKIRHLIQLNQDDIEELKQILCVELGTLEDYNNLSNGLDFAVFVRKIVGLDRETVAQLYSEYLAKYNFNTKQQEFMHDVIEYVQQNGDITDNDLINKEPFRHQEYTDIFEDTTGLYALLDQMHNYIIPKIN